MKRLMERHGAKLYAIARIIFGLLFLAHGLQKFGLLGGQAVPLASLFGLAGVIEIAVGATVALGIAARWAALLGAIEMLVAYVLVHAKQGWFPLANGGEPALLFLAAFLILASQGAGIWSAKSE